jgi:hypothetical protein
MTPEQFVVWLKGFAQAANVYNITPSQWDTICDQLTKVIDNTHSSEYTIPVGRRIWETTNTTAQITNTQEENTVL